MSVKPHYNVPGVAQLIIQRASLHEPCFFVAKDYQYYLHLLNNCAKEYKCSIHAYVLMPNHIHILATAYSDSGILHMMQALGQSYNAYINKTYGSTGTLWNGGYKSCVLESDLYLLSCMRYIELNPVRSETAEQADDYPWTSYHCNALNRADVLIRAHEVYKKLAVNDDSRLEVYRELFKTPLDNEVIHLIRDAVNNELILGSTEFKDKIEADRANRNKMGECWDCVMFY